MITRLIVILAAAVTIVQLFNFLVHDEPLSTYMVCILSGNMLLDCSLYFISTFIKDGH